MQSFPLRVLLCSVFDTFERSALRKQLNLELIFSSYRNWVPGRWHWEPAWVPINIMLLFYSHHSEIRSTSTRMVSIWKTSRSWYRCKETINSQLHFLPRIVGAHTPRWGTINLDLSVFDILFDSTFHGRPIYIAPVHQSSWIEGMQVQFWTFDPLESQTVVAACFPLATFDLHHRKSFCRRSMPEKKAES